jgi:hypothetical protein
MAHVVVPLHMAQRRYLVAPVASLARPKKGQIRKISLVAVIIKILNKWMKKITPNSKGMFGRAFSDFDCLWKLIL